MRRREFLLTACASAVPTRAQIPPLGTIAYLQPGGLWVRSLPDGRPKNLSRGGKNPRFSPSGQWIAFEGGVVRSDGTLVASLPPGRNRWLPKLDVLAVETGRDVALFHSENGWSTPLTRLRGVDLPVFSSDGTRFAYGSAVQVGVGPGGEAMANGELRLGTLDNGDSRTLVSQYLVAPIPFAWTRDSRYILYWEDPDFSASARADNLDLFRVPAAGGPSQPLRIGTLLHEDLLALSPTANHLAATVGSGREIYQENRLAILDLDTLAIRYLTPTDTSAIAPSWSPDGGSLAYVQAPVPPEPSDNRSARPYMKERRIWIAGISGAAPPNPITADKRFRDEEPMWSADGTHILFCRMDDDGTGTLWLMGAGGEDPVRVSNALPLKNGWVGYYGYIDWRSTFDWHRA